MTNAAVLAIEYCDNFHALEFDNCYEWTWGKTFEEKRDRSCCVMFVCAHLALKNSGPYVPPETYPLFEPNLYKQHVEEARAWVEACRRAGKRNEQILDACGERGDLHFLLMSERARFAL